MHRVLGVETSCFRIRDKVSKSHQNLIDPRVSRKDNMVVFPCDHPTCMGPTLETAHNQTLLSLNFLQISQRFCSMRFVALPLQLAHRAMKRGWCPNPL